MPGLPTGRRRCETHTGMNNKRVLIDSDSEESYALNEEEMPDEEQDEEQEGEEDEEDEYREEDSDLMRPCEDSVVQDRARMILEVVEEAARNLIHPFNLDDTEGEGALMHDACMRVVKVVGYLSPATSSERWPDSTKDLLATVCDARIRKVTSQEKAAVRSTTRCIVCGQQERNCQFVVDLATAKDPDAYVADDFATTPEEWPAAFSNFLEAQDKPSVVVDGVPKEFLGCFAVGSTCLKRFKQSFSAQNFILDQLRTSWDYVKALDRDPGYTRYPTCTETRVDAFCRQLDAIKTAAAVETQAVNLINHADGDLWQRVDEALLKKARGDPLKAFEIAGSLARRSLTGQPLPNLPPTRLRKSPRLAQKMDAATANAIEESEVEEAVRRSLRKKPRSEGGGTSSAPAPVVGRGPILPVVERAGGLRAPDRLPSYQRTASDLLTLAADLARSGESDRAAAATAGGMVILELVAKLHESRAV